MKIYAICFVLVSVLAISVIVDCEQSKVGGYGLGPSTRGGNPKKAAAAGKIEKIARFAIEEHNKKEHKHLQFVRVISSKEKIVAGKVYNVVLEAKDGRTVRKYEAQVLSMAWMNIKQLQEFKPV